MKSQHARSSLLALIAVIGVMYPLMVLSDALDWHLLVQAGLAATLLVAPIGIKRYYLDFGQVRAERRKRREERDDRRRARAARLARRRDGVR